MTNMKKTFFNKLLLATSSIGLLASMESSAAVVVSVPHENNTSYVMDPMRGGDRPQDWRSNNGAQYQPQNGDDIILRRAHLINFNQNININDINIYGYSASTFIDNWHNGINDRREMGGIAITPGFGANRIVTINNIINSDANNYRIAGSNALGEALIYGNKNAKVRVDLLESLNDLKLIITGNDISAVDSIVMSGGTNEIIFRNPIKVKSKIYARNILQGKVKIESNNIVFESPIGNDGRDNHSISIFKVDDNISVTLENNIAAEDINLGKNSTVIIDTTKRNIDVRSGIVVNNTVDNQGIVQVRGHAKNTVTFHENIGVQDFKAAEIQIENGKKTEFKQKVYAKKITVASNDVVFEEKLDMAQYNQNNRGNRTNLIHTGNLEFTNRGKVKFNKDYVGTITTSKANIGEVIL